MNQMNRSKHHGLIHSEEEEEDWFYSKKTRERLLEEDAITCEEDGFMEGHEADLETEPEESDTVENPDEDYEKSPQVFF